MCAAPSGRGQALPGGALLWVQEPSGGLCAPRPRFEYTKPPNLAISSSQWFTFQSRVSSIAASMMDERYLRLLTVPIFVAVLEGVLSGVLGVSLQQDEDGEAEEGLAVDLLQIEVLAGVVVLFLALWLAARCCVVSYNQKKDLEIQRACAEFSGELAPDDDDDDGDAGQLTVSYQVEHVGFVRPRHARTSRAVRIEPLAGQAARAPQAQAAEAAGPDAARQVRVVPTGSAEASIV